MVLCGGFCDVCCCYVVVGYIGGNFGFVVDFWWFIVLMVGVGLLFFGGGLGVGVGFGLGVGLCFGCGIGLGVGMDLCFGL